MAILLLAPSALAQTAGMMAFQGLIRDGGGTPIAVPVTLTFRIYAAETGGSEIGGPYPAAYPANPVTPVGGVVATHFGPVDPAVFNGSTVPRYLGVEFLPMGTTASVTLSRVPIGTPPAIAEQLNFRGTSNPAVVATSLGAVGVGTSNPQSILQVNYTGGSGPDIGLGAAGAPMASIGGLLRSSEGGNDRGDLVFRTRPEVPASTLAERMRIRADGLIGIGTSGPSAILHILHGTNSFGLPAILVDSAVSNQSPIVDIWTTREDDAKTLRVLGNSDMDGQMPSFDAFVVEADGDIRAAGRVFASSGLCSCSDARFKKGIQIIPDALDKISQLRGVKFAWKQDEFPDRHFSDGRQVGMIAQEVQKVLPEVVSRGTDGYLSVDYGRLTPVLVEAVHEQQGEIKSLRQENDRLRTTAETLERRLSALEARLSGGDRKEGGR